MILFASAFESAQQTLSDALGSGDLVMIIAALVVIGAVVGLKLAGKSIPLVDTVLEVLLNALKSSRPKPQPPAQEKPLEGSMGAATPDDVAQIEAKLQADGFMKQADGTWKRV